LNGKVGEKKSTAKAKAPPSPESESESIFEAVKVSLESGSKNVGRKDQGEREHTLKARKAHTEKGVTVDDVLVDTEDEEDDDDEGSHGSNIQFEY